MRGNPAPGGNSLVALRSIPAYAGEPGNIRFRIYAIAVYPRVCGGTGRQFVGEYGRVGLSPRMRGNPGMSWGGDGMSGSIPAYAGEPSPMSQPRGGESVYPRVCGGTGVTLQFSGITDGLSPRMRGNPGKARRAPADRGSIPAYAGEPALRRSAYWLGRVYPRVCGGTAGLLLYAAALPGLSPRMRGNPLAF